MNLRITSFAVAAALVAQSIAAVAKDKDYVAPEKASHSTTVVVATGSINDTINLGLTSAEVAKISKITHKAVVKAAEHPIVGSLFVDPRVGSTGVHYTTQKGILTDRVDVNKMDGEKSEVVVTESALVKGGTVVANIGGGVGMAVGGFGLLKEGKAAEVAANAKAKLDAARAKFLKNKKGVTSETTTNTVVNNGKTENNNITGSTITTVKNTASGNGQIKADGNVGFGSNLNGANTSLSGGSAQNFTNDTSTGGVSAHANGRQRNQNSLGGGMTHLHRHLALNHG